MNDLKVTFESKLATKLMYSCVSIYLSLFYKNL